MSPWRDVELEASLAGYRWAPRTPVCPHAASLHVDFPLPACLWIWQHLFTVLVGFFVSHWLLTHKAFPSSFPWLEQHPQRPGCSRGVTALWLQSSDDHTTSGARRPVRLAQRANRFVPEDSLCSLCQQSPEWPSAFEPVAELHLWGDPSSVFINRSRTWQAAVSRNSRSEWPLRHCKRDSSTRYFHTLSVSQGKTLGSCFCITAREYKELLNKKWI